MFFKDKKENQEKENKHQQSPENSHQRINESLRNQQLQQQRELKNKAEQKVHTITNQFNSKMEANQEDIRSRFSQRIDNTSPIDLANGIQGRSSSNKNIPFSERERKSPREWGEEEESPEIDFK